ncbi:MAG: winged helix-turn-helix domain-containing protein [Candidatus Hodarchaeota archaeon]
MMTYGRDLKINKIEDQSKNNENQDIEGNFYYALGHELRRKIIKIIGDNDFSSFTNLKNELKVSTGTIYHHLDSLSKLIEQGEDKKYYLTDLGVHAYNSLKSNIETIISPDFSRREFRSPILKGLMLLTPNQLINYSDNKKLYTLFISTIILIVGGIFCGLNNFFPIFLFFGEFPLSSSPGFYILFGIFYFINFFAYALLIEGICRLFYKKGDNSSKLFISFGIIFLPMVLYLIIHQIFILTDIIMFPFVGVIDNILMILLQVWSLWLLAYNLIVNKNLKIENALIISFLLHYGGFSVVLLFSI